MDAVTVEVLRNKISSLVDEMHYHFYRSGYSTIVRESRDFSCVVLDREGRLIVAPPMLFHAPVYRHLIGRILELYGGAIGDGDIFVSNHPYEGGLPHVSDMAFVAPVFAAGSLVAFIGSIAHKADVGGAVPGSTSANATELFQEGLLVPPIRIWKAGRPLPDIERLILANSRQPELVRGDMHAQVAATQMGVARIAELCRRFGAARVTAAFAAILDGAAAGLRAAIASLPEGRATAEGLLDSDGVDVNKPLKLAVAVTMKEGCATFDFSASAPQARGPVNLGPAMVEACVYYAVIGCLDPLLPFNDGVRDAVRIVLAPRTITNAAAPAPVSNYQMVNRRLIDLILEALAVFNPVRAIAHGGSSTALSIAWTRGRPAQPALQYEIIGSGSAYGAGPGHDGMSATSTHMSNVHITPIEILESEFPCRITRFDLVRDSGGPGRWRGGLSLRREYELLEDATVICRFEKTRFPPSGLAGGRAGMRSRLVIGLGTEGERELPASARLEMKAGARFVLQSAGGGGYGSADERDRSRLAHDIAEGYVSRDGAACYGGDISSESDASGRG